MLKKLLRLPIQIFVFVLFIVVLILGLAQLQFVRNEIRDILVSKLNQSLNGKVYIAELRGNFINYLELSGVALTLDNDYIFKADGATIKLNPFALLNNKIVINEFRLINPQINLKKNQNGKWNFELISSGTPDTSSSESNLSFDLSGIEIINGALEFNSKTHPDKNHVNGFDTDRFTLEALNFAIDLEIYKEYKKIEIGHLSFIQNRKNILRELSGIIYLDKSGVKVNNLNLEFNNTYLTMNAYLLGLDLEKDEISLEKLKGKKCGFTLNAPSVNSKDLQYFIPDIDMLNGSLGITLDASGTLDNLSLNKLQIVSEGTNLNITGKVLNITEPEKMAFEVQMPESEIDLADIRDKLLPLDLPDYSAAGKVKIKLNYTGKPDNFDSDINIEGNFGKLNGKVKLDMSEKIPKYNIKLLGSNLNLKPFLGNSFDSKINCRISGAGSGFDINDVNTEIDVEIDSSRFLHQPIDRSRIAITFINRHCNALIAFAGGDTKIGLNTEFNLSRKNDQSYSFNLAINNLDVSKFTNDPNMSTDINISSAISGEYLSIDKTSGQAIFYIFPSRFRSDSIPELSFNLKYNQEDPEDRRISLYSDIADLELKGLYSVESFSKNVPGKLQKLFEEISTTLPFPAKEETKVLLKPEKQWLVKNQKKTAKQKIAAQALDSIDLDYSIHIKKPGLIKNYLKSKEINTDIRLDGRLIAGEKSLSLTGNAKVDNLFYLSEKNNILMQDMLLDYKISSPAGDERLMNLNNKISVKMPILYLNKNVIRNTEADISTEKNITNLSLSGNFEGKTDFKINGKVLLGKTEHGVEFSKVNIKHANYEWKNKENIVCFIRNDGFDIQSLILNHDKEEIVLEGSINKEGEQNLSLLVNNLSIENILSITSTDTIPAELPILSGKLNMRGEIFGTAAEPLMNFYIKTDSLATNNKYLGSLFGNAHYEESTLYTNFQFQSSGIESLRKSDLLLIGTFPINLSLSSDEPLFPEDEEIDLYLVSNKLPLRLVSLIIPDLQNPTGNADMNIRVFGTGNAPEIEGYLTLNRGNLTLKQNGMTYIAQGRVDISTKDIKMAMSLENLPEDRRDGRVDIGGIIKMVDLKPDEIDIKARGQLQVLRKDKRKSNDELYGDLFIAIAGDGLKYNQNISSKTGNVITGSLLVKDADLVLPLGMNSGGSSSQSENYRFIVIDDTSHIRPDSNQIRKMIMKSEYEKYVADNQATISPSAMNKLGFRFDVKTLGNAKIEIEMNANYGEALVAEIGGNISIVKSGPNMAIYGSADIGNKSYYKFAGKQFDALGKIVFTGSVDNPELNISASYQGVHTNREVPGNTKEEKVVATISMTGTLAEPTPKYELTVDGKIRDKGDVFADIMSFILTGQFNEELTSNQKQNLASGYTSSLYSIGSGVISGKLTEFFRNEFEFIKSVETEYSGELTNTNVKISGEIGKTAIIRFGGKVFSDINNTNINLELPVGKIINNESLRNLILEIYRNTSESTKTPEKEKIPFFGTRIFYRINF